MDVDPRATTTAQAVDHRSGQQAWLWAGVAAVVVSLLAQVPGTRAAHWVGYVLGSFVTILLVALYRRTDRRASSSPWYSPRPTLDRVAFTALLLGVASAVLHAYFIAVDVAR